MEDRSPLPPRVRPHHLICLLAFEGGDYSDSFDRRFGELREAYLSGSLLHVVEGADDACSACRFHHPAKGCISPVDGPDARVAALDDTVLELLHLSPGFADGGELLSKVRLLGEEDFRRICSQCSWYGKTDCRARIRRRLDDNPPD